jgi:hypothetical protein
VTLRKPGSLVESHAPEGSLLAQLHRIFEAYDAQGFHRTGSDADARSAHWLADEIRAAGLEPVLVAFPHRRLDPLEARVEVAGRAFDGVPLFDAALTDAEGAVGAVGSLGSAAAIGVAGLPPAWNAPGGGDFLAARREGSHRALVAVCDGTRLGVRAGLTLLNAEHFDAPFGPPVLQVPTQAGAFLMEAAASGAEGRVVCRARRTPVKALNVEARLAGADPTLAPLVVMTPRSGWWQCASERGGGLACWLELMRALSAGRPRRDVRFVATTGHELGHLGLKHFLHEDAGLVKGARAWIHLGANFAAAAGPALRFQASDAELASLGVAALRDAGAAPDAEVPMGSRPLGEASDIFDGGGRYVSLLGANGLFHHPDDRWPDAVDLEKTARIATGLCSLARHLADAP